MPERPGAFYCVRAEDVESIRTARDCDNRVPEPRGTGYNFGKTFADEAMPISATCQQCGATLPVPDQYAGQSVRCGGCRGVVKVPALATPTAPLAAAVPKARPVALPVARKVPAEAKPAPIRTARKVRDEDETPPDLDLPDPPERKRDQAKARPLAKRRRDSILTVAAGKWLVCFLMTGVVGLGVLAYAAWGQRKNDGTALTPSTDPRR